MRAPRCDFLVLFPALFTGTPSLLAVTFLMRSNAALFGSGFGGFGTSQSMTAS